MTTTDTIDENYYVNVKDLMPPIILRPRLKIISWSSGEDP
jgi:hypothetical protein